MDDKIDLVADLVKTLAHPTRIQNVNLLSQTSWMNVTELCKQLQSEPSGVSHHLIKMRDRGILTHVRQQNNSWYGLADAVYGKLIELVIDNPFVRKDS